MDQKGAKPLLHKSVETWKLEQLLEEFKMGRNQVDIFINVLLVRRLTLEEYRMWALKN